MPRQFVVSVAFVLACGLAAAARSDEKDDKPIKLFNGRNLDGWTFHTPDKSAKTEDVWSVNKGVLACQGKPAGYLRTEDDYTNYVLKLQWRFDADKGAGNSGVLLRMVGEDKVWPKSIEAQLHSGDAGDFWNIDMFEMTVDEDRTEGRRTKKLKESNEKPLGEWNQYEITVEGGSVRLVVNGELQNEATDCEEIAGKICLQSEGSYIEFRNIELTPLE
jgi:hypothetical protein